MDLPNRTTNGAIGKWGRSRSAPPLTFFGAQLFYMSAEAKPVCSCYTPRFAKIGQDIFTRGARFACRTNRA